MNVRMQEIVTVVNKKVEIFKIKEQTDVFQKPHRQQTLAHPGLTRMRVSEYFYTLCRALHPQHGIWRGGLKYLK